MLLLAKVGSVYLNTYAILQALKYRLYAAQYCCDVLSIDMAYAVSSYPSRSHIIARPHIIA